MIKLFSLASVPTMSVGRPTPNLSSIRTRSRQSMAVWAAQMTATTTQTKLKSDCAQNGQMRSSSERPYYRSYWYATFFHVSISSPKCLPFHLCVRLMQNVSLSLQCFTSIYLFIIMCRMRNICQWVIPCQINQFFAKFASPDSDFDEIWHTWRLCLKKIL